MSGKPEFDFFRQWYELVEPYVRGEIHEYLWSVRNKDIFFRLYFDREYSERWKKGAFGYARYERISGILSLLDYLKKEGLDYEVKDTSRISFGELKHAYRDVAHLALEKKIRVADAFSGASRGSLFGKFVPALLVYRKANEDLIDVAPKESSFLKPLIAGDSIETLLRLIIEINAIINEEKPAPYDVQVESVAEKVIRKVLWNRRS